MAQWTKEPKRPASSIWRNTLYSMRIHLSAAHKKKFGGIAVLILFSSILDVIGLASVLPLVKAGTSPEVIHTNKYLSWVYEQFNFSSDKSFLLFLVLAVLVFQVARSAFGLFVNYIEGKFMADVATTISKNQFSKYFSLSYFNFNTVKSSAIINHVQQNPASFVSWIVLPIMTIFSEMVILLLIVGMIAAYNLQLFFFILATVGPCTALIYYAVKNKNERLGRSLDQMYPLALSQLTYSIMGYVDIKLANKIDYYKNRFSRFQKDFHDLSMSGIVLNMVPLRGNEMVAVLGIMVIFVYAVFFNDKNQDIIMMVGAFAAAAYRLMPSLNRILNSLMYIGKNQVAIDNMNAYNELYTKVKEMNRDNPIPFSKEIEFKNVSFTFPKAHKPVLNNINLTVKKGEKIGFVGSSGSGKTTLMNILLRFFEQDSGEILVDGKPLKEENLNYWRNLIGYVKQDIFLFDTSIKENIAFGEDNINEELLTASIRQASLDTFIKSLPKGWDSDVGERGSKLSGGQRQRIGIARSLYRNAEILVFDEATSALDTQTEQEVSESIDALSHTNKTIFIIAHRITTLKNCDRIYELKDGEVAGIYQYRDLAEKIFN